MVAIYVKKIRDPKSHFTIDQVPAKWRAAVEEALANE